MVVDAVRCAMRHEVSAARAKEEDMATSNSWKVLAVTVARGASLSSGVGVFAQRPGGAPVSVLATGGGAALLDPSDTVILLLDHQAGLFQTVKDIDVAELRRNTIMLARLATLLKIPVITTASEPGGPNGPLMPESTSPRRTRSMFRERVR
jgi:hypothetical protein